MEGLTCPGCRAEFTPHGNTIVCGIDVCETCQRIVIDVLMERAYRSGWLPRGERRWTDAEKKAADDYITSGDRPKLPAAGRPRRELNCTCPEGHRVTNPRCLLNRALKAREKRAQKGSHLDNCQ